MNIQHTSNTYSTVRWRNLDPEGKRQIQNHSNRDEIFEKNRKIHSVWPQKGWRRHEKTQNTTSSGKYQQLQTQMATTLSQNEQTSTPYIIVKY
jgi:hypothetical protein